MITCRKRSPGRESASSGQERLVCSWTLGHCEARAASLGWGRGVGGEPWEDLWLLPCALKQRVLKTSWRASRKKRGSNERGAPSFLSPITVPDAKPPLIVSAQK